MFRRLLPMLTNSEKSPIEQVLRVCIGELRMILVDSHELLARRDKTAVDPVKVENGYQEMMDIIKKAYNNPLNGDEFNIETKQVFFLRTGLDPIYNKLRALFHPEFNIFVKLAMTNNPFYTKKSDEISQAVFDSKIPQIKEFIVSRLEKIIDRTPQLSKLKSDLKFFNREETKENDNDSIKGMNNT